MNCIHCGHAADDHDEDGRCDVLIESCSMGVRTAQACECDGYAPDPLHTDDSDRDDTPGADAFGESPAGYRARDKWARRYDELNGAPESEYDR